MSKNALTPVSAKTVRTVLSGEGFTLTDAALHNVQGRGRLHPDTIAAFNEQNSEGQVFVPAESKAAAKRTMTLPLTKPNSRGARLKRPEAFPVSEVRALAGCEGKRGRLSSAHIAAAVSAVQAQRGW